MIIKVPIYFEVLTDSPRGIDLDLFRTAYSAFIFSRYSDRASFKAGDYNFEERRRERVGPELEGFVKSVRMISQEEVLNTLK
jgi:hypothetical protein